MKIRSVLPLIALFVSVTAHATHPLAPYNLAQRVPGGSSIPAGGQVTGTSVELTATSSSSTYGGTYYLDIEIRPVAQTFQGVATHSTSLYKSSSTSNHQYPWVLVSNLTPGSYKWQARERTSTSSSWVQFNAGQTAFTIGGVLLSPSSVSFGNVRVGQTSTASAVELTNNSTAAINVTAASITGPFAIDSGPTLPVSLPVGDKLTWSLTATPTATGSQTGELTVTSDAVNSPHISGLSVTGALPNLVLNPTSVAFGEVAINSAGKTQTVTVQNTGNAPLTISGATAAAPFSVSGVQNLIVAAGQSATFDVTYSPTAQGMHSATITLNSDDPNAPHSLPVSGTGVEPKLSLSDSTLSFPDTIVGAQSAAMSVTAANTGTGTLNVGAPTISAGFTTTLTAGPIAEAAMKSFDVVFAPTAPGPITGTLTIPSDDASGSKTIALSGTARAPSLAASPTSHSFGTVTLGNSQTTVLTLTNAGDAPLSISQLTFSGSQQQDYTLVTPPTLPATVAANGGTLQLTVRFAPQGLGVRSAALNITSNKYPAGVVSVSFTGSGHGPLISVSPTSLSFGSVNVGSSTLRTVNVSNSGTAPLTVSAITFSTLNTSDFSTTQAVPFTVQPGASTTVSIKFQPNAAGSRASKATIVSNDSVTPSVDVALSGTGLSPNIAVTPLSVSHGQVRVGQSDVKTISIQNTGTGPLTITNLMFTGNDAPRFSYSGVGTPFTLSAGAPAATISITFAPNAVGAANAQLAIVSDDPDTASLQVALSGEGIAPGVSLSATTLNFGAQVVNRTSAPRTVELTNTGTASLQVSSLAVTGTGSASYAITGPATPFNVAPGMSQAITLVMTPSAAGESLARLSLQTDATGAQNAYVDLVGLGITDVFSVNPASLDFGVVKVNTIGDSFSVTLQNMAADELPLSSAMITGPGASEFEVTFVGSSLPSGGTATAQVTFKPKSAGTHTAELQLGSTDSRIPVAKVSLTGSSVSRILEVSPSAYDFGAVQMGQTASQVFAISNKTSKPIRLVSFTSSSTEFAADTSGLGVIEPGRSGNLTVTFSPAAEHLTLGTLGIAIEGQEPGQAEATITLSGTGTPAAQEKTGCSAVGGPFAVWALIALAVPALLRRRRG